MFNREYSIVFEDIGIEPITDLRIQFRADKSSGTTINRGVITIFNLHPTKRKALTHRDVSIVNLNKSANSDKEVTSNNAVAPKVHLLAGYVGNLKEVIAGDIYQANSTRLGSDWVTTLHIYSGYTNAMNAVTNISYSGKTPAKQIADNLIAPMNIPTKYTNEALKKLDGITFEDMSISALSFNYINTFLERFNLAFTIEDHNQGLVYLKDSPRELNQPRTNDNSFNINNGLIGSPNITRSGVDIVSLLRPELKLLQSIYVESQSINELVETEPKLTNKYYIRNITHLGDTHGEEWYTQIEAFYADLAVDDYAV